MLISSNILSYAEFVAETLLQTAGATWFRVSFYKLGSGSSALLAGIVGEDGTSNFRMLHSSFVTQNYVGSTVSVATMPTVTWTPVDLRPSSSNGSSLDPFSWPGATTEGMKWEIWDFVIFCGGGTPDCMPFFSASIFSLLPFGFYSQRGIWTSMRYMETLNTNVGLVESHITRSWGKLDRMEDSHDLGEPV